MRRVRHHKRMLSLLTLLVLVGGMMASAFSSASAFAASSQASAVIVDPVLGPLALCTSADHQEWPGDGRSDSETQSGHCALCTLAAALSAAVILTATPVAFCESLIGIAPRTADLGTLADHLRLGGIRSRAPPLSA